MDERFRDISGEGAPVREAVRAPPPPKDNPDTFLDAFDEFTSPKRQAVDMPKAPSSPKAAPAPSAKSSEPARRGSPRQLGGLSVQRASDLPPAMAQAAPVAEKNDAQTKADEYYEMCMNDLQAGRVARAWGYAKMAADADPANEKYQLLVKDWNKMTGGNGLPSAAPADSALSEGQRLIAAAQEAESQGNLEQAIDYMRQACEMFPDSGSAYNRLAVLLARAKNFNAACAMAQKAVDIEPDNATYRDNMMKLLAKAEEPSAKTSKGPGGFLAKLLK